MLDVLSSWGGALRQQEATVALEEIIRAVAELNDEERQRLRQHIARPPQKTKRLQPKERTQRLNAALDRLSDGLSEAQLNEMTAAMTEKYIEAWDESLWSQ